MPFIFLFSIHAFRYTKAMIQNVDSIKVGREAPNLLTLITIGIYIYIYTSIFPYICSLLKWNISCSCPQNISPIHSQENEPSATHIILACLDGVTSEGIFSRVSYIQEAINISMLIIYLIHQSSSRRDSSIHKKKDGLFRR